MCVRKMVHACMIRTRATSDEVFDAIVRIAIEAGEKIMAIYRGEFAVTRTNDDSPLTQADLAAHRHILAALHALTPDIPVLSEDAADIPYPTRSRWSRYWPVDHLARPPEFIKRHHEFTVNIAPIEERSAEHSCVMKQVLA